MNMKGKNSINCGNDGADKRRRWMIPRSLDFGPKYHWMLPSFKGQWHFMAPKETGVFNKWLVLIDSVFVPFNVLKESCVESLDGE